MSMKQLYFLCVILTYYKNVNSEIEPFIVGGNYTTIKEHPHSVFLNVVCGRSFICGGSILNQDVVLTAAHCLDKCTGTPKDTILIKYGHENLKYMKSTKMKVFKMHPYYNEATLDNDLGLLTCTTPIQLGDNVKRVVIMEHPPLEKLADVAGWGVINKNRNAATTLKHATQKLHSREICNALGSLPKGKFCAGPIFESEIGQPDFGDSGSALTIQSYIQIGIVSYKIDGYNLVIYTNVSYHRDWINYLARRLVCLEELPFSK